MTTGMKINKCLDYCDNKDMYDLFIYSLTARKLCNFTVNVFRQKS